MATDLSTIPTLEKSRRNFDFHKSIQIFFLKINHQDMYQIHFRNRVFFSYLIISSSFLVWQKASSLDPYYQACVPKHCGNGLNISYPFHISGQQPSYCGYPGFDLSCNEHGYPIFHWVPEEYIVDQIFYQNRSFRAYNAVVSSSNRSCLLQIKNLTFANEMTASFSFINSRSSLYLLSNCNKSMSEELMRYKVSCDDVNGDDWGLAILDKDKNLKDALKECKSAALTPVELHGSDGTAGIIGNYTELLRRGIVLGWKFSDCHECTKSGGRCGFDTDSFRCFCPDGPRPWSCNSGSKRNLELKVVIGISASGILSAVILCLCITRKHFSGYTIRFWKKAKKHENIEAFLKNNGSLATKRYNYSDIKKITDSFKEKLGQGGYGCVYKGVLRDGSFVAVKVLHDSKDNGEEFVNEVASISKTSHVNVVSLLGFCFQGSRRALVYEFMPNGSLEKFIYSKNSSSDAQLGWENMFQIAVGIARGLEYLHRGCNTKILHFDIKPHNILLNKDFRPKISDFGLAKLCPDTASKISLLGARGTIGYIAPEVFCRPFGEVSHKSDVYSYGMMILEMVGGRKDTDAIVDLTSEFYFPHWIHEHLDSEEIGLCGITNKDEYEKARKMVIAGLWCIQTFPVKRPSMSRVLEMLEGSMECVEMPPKPFLSSPPRLLAADSTTS